MTSSQSPNAPLPTVESVAAGHLRIRVEDVAARLAGLAETVKHCADDIALTGGPGRPNYATTVAVVVHEVNTALMNLNLRSLVTAAATADIARAKGE